LHQKKASFYIGFEDGERVADTRRFLDQPRRSHSDAAYNVAIPDISPLSVIMDTRVGVKTVETVSRPACRLVA